MVSRLVGLPSQTALDPDFCLLDKFDDGRIKHVRVHKCPWHQIASGQATAPDLMTQKSTLRQALAQMYKYMELNSCRHGALSTYTFTWFGKRSSVKGELLISPLISFNRESPTLFKCYYLFSSL